VVAHLNAGGVPAVESLSAGTFLCNHALYTAAHHCAVTRPDTRVGFIHLPLLLAQTAAVSGRKKPPGMALATQVAGVRLALEFLANEGP
jgi:pyroglutamyl-peptidase